MSIFNTSKVRVHSENGLTYLLLRGLGCFITYSLRSRYLKHFLLELIRALVLSTSSSREAKRSSITLTNTTTISSIKCTMLSNQLDLEIRNLFGLMKLYSPSIHSQRGLDLENTQGSLCLMLIYK